MPDSAAQKRPRSLALPLLVIAAFVLPIAIAWWLVDSGVGLADSKLVNHGTLVAPPIDIRADTAGQRLAGIPLQPSEWAMLYFAPGACEQACERHVELLKTIRSVLGHDGTRVRVAVLTDDAREAGAGAIAMGDAAVRAWLATTLSARTNTAVSRGFALLDWRGQVVMYFPDTAPPDDIKADLKRLLRASAIR